MPGITTKVANILWEHSIIGLAKISLDGKWIKANAALSAILEYSPSELEGMYIKHITHPKDVNDDLEMIRRVTMKEVPFYLMSKRFITKSNKIVWVKLRVDPITTDEGDIEALLSQVSPGLVLEKESLEDSVDNFNKPPKDGFLKRNLKWLISLVSGVGLVVIGSIYNDESMKHLGELVVMGTLAGKSIDSEIKKSKES